MEKPSQAGKERAKAAQIRVRAGRLCVTSNRLEKRARRLYGRITALMMNGRAKESESMDAEAELLDDQIADLVKGADALYAEANLIDHGATIRRSCLKCACSFPSPDFSCRLCPPCRAGNLGLREAPRRSPKMNRKPMSVERVSCLSVH